MPEIHIEKILSVSSEDPAFPAQNLLNPDNSKKWKCKTGEKQASVILQLKQETFIEGIDVGNEGSAFIEVLVGKSSSPSNEFKVLLVASTLMTLKEAKDGSNTSGVRFFRKADLTKPTVDEKWDKVKIVCTQPFNRHVQYGLSFIVLHSSDGKGEVGENSGSLGKFFLKEEDTETPVTIGSWFAKRKDPPPLVPPGAAASIRDASSPINIARAKAKMPTPKMPKTPKNAGAIKPVTGGNLKKNPKPGPIKVQKATLPLHMSLGDDEDSPADDTDADSTYSPNKDSASVISDDDVIPDESDEEDTGKRGKKTRQDKKGDAAKDTKNGTILNGQTRKRKLDDSGNTIKPKTSRTERVTKPFAQLLEGVTIVISGYQNPLRGDLRSKACALGAKYKADWDSTCTHLICAFVNTPKFNQVRGRGKIVKKEWVEECYNQRKRLPWRRFALDRNDSGTSSEEEIWEKESVPTTSTVTSAVTSGVNRRRVNSSSGSDTEEEIERVRARQIVNKPTLPAQVNKKTPETKEPNKQVTQKSPEKTNPYADDTDVDSESESQTANLPLPPLPDFFDNIVLHIASDIDVDERSRLKRYIISYKGTVVDEMDGTVEYVVTNQPEIAMEVAEEYGISAVTPEWVWQCSDAGQLVPVTEFLL